MRCGRRLRGRGSGSMRREPNGWGRGGMRRCWQRGTALSGGFFDTASDHEALIGRPRELTDNATPSGTSLAAEGLLRLAAFTGEERYREHAARIVVPLAPAMVDQPSAFGHLLGALDDFIG